MFVVFYFPFAPGGNSPLICNSAADYEYGLWSTLHQRKNLHREHSGLIKCCCSEFCEGNSQGSTTDAYCSPYASANRFLDVLRCSKS